VSRSLLSDPWMLLVPSVEPGWRLGWEM